MSKHKFFYEGSLSRKINFSQGTGQGRILAPFMYKVYVNGLLNVLSNHCYAIFINGLRIPSLSFADDIPYDLLKSRISNLVHNAFRKKDGSVRYNHIKVTRAEGYFTHDINGGGDNMCTADNICKMIEFLIDNIFVQFGGRLFRQAIGIPVGTNCAPLLADLFFTLMRTNF